MNNSNETPETLNAVDEEGGGKAIRAAKAL